MTSGEVAAILSYFARVDIVEIDRQYVKCIGHTLNFYRLTKGGEAILEYIINN